jgi:hypothetical protein
MIDTSVYPPLGPRWYRVVFGYDIGPIGGHPHHGAVVDGSVKPFEAGRGIQGIAPLALAIPDTDVNGKVWIAATAFATRGGHDHQFSLGRAFTFHLRIGLTKLVKASSVRIPTGSRVMVKAVMGQSPGEYFSSF